MDEPSRRLSTEGSSSGNLMSVVRSALELLESTRVTERRDGVERLLGHLSDEKVCKILDQNQQFSRKQTPGAVNWSDMFRVTEIYLRKEYEAGDADRMNAKKKQAFSLLHRIISTANRDKNKPMLEANFLLAHITRFLSHRTIPSVHGQQIITIINQFLSIPSYVTSTRGEEWSHFIRVVAAQIKKNFTPLQPLYEILIQAATHGADHPECMSGLRTWVVDVYRSAIASPDVFTDYPILIMDGFLRLCKLIAVEARGILCTVVGTKISSVLNYLRTPEEHEKACELFVVLLKLHASSDHHGHMSFWVENASTSTWSDIVGTLYNYCHEEIEKIGAERRQRSSSSRRHLQLIPKNLLQLAVLSTKLMELKPSDLPHVEPPAKKAKNLVEFHQVIQDTLSITNGMEQLTWLTYIGAVLEDYPEIQPVGEKYQDLLNAGASLLTSTFLTFQEVFSYLRNLLQYERFLIQKGVLDECSPVWSHIWDILMRSFPVQKPLPESFRLMRDVLVHVKPGGIGPLVSLYASGALPLTQHSLLLLQQLVLSCDIPSDVLSLSGQQQQFFSGPNYSLRLSIIRWLLPARDKELDDDMIEKLVTPLLFSLLVQRPNEILEAEQSSKFVGDAAEDFHHQEEEFERIFLLCTFKCNGKSESVGRKSTKELSTPSFVDLETTVKPLLKFLDEDFQDLMASMMNMKAGVAVMRLNHLIFRAQLYLKLVNLVKKYKLADDREFQSAVVLLLKSSLDKCATCLSTFLLSEKDLDGIRRVIRLLSKLLSTEDLNTETTEFLQDLFPSSLVGPCLTLVRKRFEKGPGEANGTSESGDEMNNSSSSLIIGDRNNEAGVVISVSEQKDLVTLEAINCISSFASIAENDKRCEWLSKVLDLFLLGSDGSLFFFNVCTEFLSKTWGALACVEGTEIVNKIMELLQCLCQKYLRNFACTARLWDVFADLTPVIRKWGEEPKFMILVGNLSTFVYTQGIKSCRSYFRLMEKLAEHDPDLIWTHYLPRKAPNEEAAPRATYILLELHRFLRLTSHMIRLSAVDAISSVFGRIGWVKVDPTLSEQEFLLSTEHRNMSKNDRIKLWCIQIRDALNDTFHAPAQYTSAEKLEEGVNCVAVVLLCLTKLAFANEYIEQPMLYLLMKTTTERNILQSLACAALEQASPSDFRKCTKLYAPVNLEMWVRNGGKHEDLPYTLFSCENKERFYVVYFREIVANLVARGRWNELENLALAMKATSMELIRRSFCETFSRLVAKSLATGDLNYESTEVLKRRLGGDKGLQSSTRTSLSALVLAILSNVLEADICVEWECPGVLLPDFVSIPLAKHSVPKALSYVQKILGDMDQSILHYLAETSPRSIYSILLELATRVHDAHSTHSRLWRLSHFVIFVDMVVEETKSDFHFVSGYLCHFVIHAYLRFLNLRNGGTSSEVRFQLAVLYNLRTFIQRLIKLDMAKVEEFYNLLIHRLTLAVSSSPGLEDGIAKLFDLLICQNHQKFSIPVSKLDPFPDRDFFKDYAHIASGYQSSPDDEDVLQVILDNVEARKCAPTKELLVMIREILSNNKPSLAALVNQGEGKRFHDECAGDLIHRLIRVLVQMINRNRSDVASPEENETRIEASKCLGELGPLDLSVLVLPPYGEAWSIVNSDAAVRTLITLVTSYLDDEDIRVVTCTMQVMKKLLELPDFSQFLDQDCKDRRLVSLLVPFKSGSNNSQRNNKTPVTINVAERGNVEVKLVVNEAWDHAEWIVSVTCALIDLTGPAETVLCRIKPLCALKPDFCEEVLPFVVHSILMAGKKHRFVRQLLSQYFCDFFSNFVRLSEAPEHEALGRKRAYSLYLSKTALRVLLRCVQYLREHQVPDELTENSPATSWDSNFWLDWNYLNIAKAAQYCDAYLTSAMFAELYALQVKTVSRRESQNSEDTPSMVGSFNLPQTEKEKVQRLLVKAYIRVGESDGVYGCGSARFSDVTSEVQYLESSQSWDEVLYANDSRIGSALGVCNAIKNLGLFNTCWTQLGGIKAQRGGVLDENVSDIEYECGWRLGQWKINSDRVTYLEDSYANVGTFHKFVYQSMQASLGGDVCKLNEAVRRGYNFVLEEMKNANLESSENLYGFLSKLQMLRVVEDMSQAASSTIKDVSRKWKTQHKIPSADFKYQEPILSVKKVMLSSLVEKFGRSVVKACDSALLELVTKARDAGRLELAVKYAHELSGTSAENSVRKQVEIAKNHWAKGKCDIALDIVNGILNKIPHKDADNTYASLLLLHGEWLFQSLGERPSLISQKFQNASRLYELNPKSTPEDVAKTYITLGEYADTQFQKLADYIQSDLFQQKIDHLQKSKEDQAKVASIIHDNDMKKTLMFMRKQWTIDSTEIQNVYQESTRYRLLALQYYMKALDKSDKYDLFIFRAIALWLNKSRSDTPDLMNEADQKMIENPIQSYKYIAVLHQLSARLGSSSRETSDALEGILLKCAEEHPYHTLPVILTQAMLHKDRQFGSRGDNSRVAAVAGGEQRISAAMNILKKLKGMKKTAGLTAKMEKLWNALIWLANFQEGSRGLDKRNLPKCELLELKDLADVPVLTLDLPVNPSGKYDIVGIREFKQTYQLVGGINSPKKISCRAMNGQTYNMLLKGNDDLRQDAVMQQVFGVMNQLLNAEPKTRKKRLVVRTYKVVPLSQRSGIIEWCENTQTFGDYLVGDSRTGYGAHGKYRPSDLKPTDCRRMMMEVKDCGDNRKKLENFMKILENFKPVFHHFFFENFKDAGTFFERRLAYTRSVATSSIVGYILGLGDRHVLNILIDKKTAEVIHIDLGVAFEQGRLLPTPETIPFRLTRDIVDGMGFCGTEGVFRRSCESTMEVLRKNADIMLTILEVLLYDPLYLWTLTEDRKRKLQPVSDRSQASRKSSGLGGGSNESDSSRHGEHNNTAAGELRRLKCKLAGIQEGRTSGSTISVPGHVSQLINNAMDTTQLSRLFPGWQPYL